MKLTGLLLAAGRGRRMDGNKQFHLVQTPTGEKPLAAAAFDTIAPVCGEMIVVLGHRADEVATVLKKGTQLFFECVTSDPDAPMIESIKTGLRVALNNSRRQAPTRSVGRLPGNPPPILLQLGDHPSLEPSTLNRLLSTAADNPDKAVMPTYHGNGGHPVLIPRDIGELILTADCPDGLRGFWLDHPDLCMRIEVDDPGVIHNINSL